MTEHEEEIEELGEELIELVAGGFAPRMDPNG